jgi:hypothetical protein
MMHGLCWLKRVHVEGVGLHSGVKIAEGLLSSRSCGALGFRACCSLHHDIQLVHAAESLDTSGISKARLKGCALLCKTGTA